MNATQAENLRILIRHMETKCDRVLDMRLFMYGCGTPACAAGECTLIPEFVSQGMTDAWALSGPTNQFALITDVFGEEARLKGIFSADGRPWGRTKVSPKAWAVEARKVLAENGYSMDEAKPVPTVRERLDAIYAAPLDEAPEVYETPPTLREVVASLPPPRPYRRGEAV